MNKANYLITFSLATRHEPQSVSWVNIFNSPHFLVALFVLNLCAISAPNSTLADTQRLSEKGKITGIITSHNNIQTTTNLKLIIRLLDVSIADRDANVISEIIIDPLPAIPLPFEINYPGEIIKASNRYSISAEIYQKENSKKYTRLFITKQHFPVITYGAGNKINVMVEPI